MKRVGIRLYRDTARLLAPTPSLRAGLFLFVLLVAW